MGVRAAAERFGLAFHPLGEETYFLVLHAGNTRDPRILDLMRRVRDATRRLGGYRR
jgi:molybdate-binding protein